MQSLEVSGAVRPLQWSLGVKGLIISLVVNVCCRHTKNRSGYSKLLTLLVRSRSNLLPFPVSLIIGGFWTHGFIQNYQCFGGISCSYVLEGWLLQNAGTYSQVPTKNPGVSFKKTEPHMSPVSTRKID